MIKKKQSKLISKITLNHPSYKLSPLKNEKQLNTKRIRDDSSNQIIRNRGINKQNFENNQLSHSNKFRIVDYINAQYFGEQLKNNPNGQGLFIDDQFNLFVCQNWKNKQMNGMSFIKLNNQTFLYGTWNQGKMIGQYAICKHSYIMIFDSEIISSIKVKRKSQICLIDKQLNLIYIVEVTLSQQPAKLQIVDRVPVTFNMILNRQIQQEIQKVVDPSQALGYQIPKYLLSSMGFLNYMCKHTRYIKPIDIKSQKCMLSLFSLNKNQQSNVNKDNWNNQQKLGIVIQLQTLKTVSIGKYNNKNQLNGLGIAHGKNESMIGIFKQDMLKTEFNYEQLFSKIHKIVTPQVKNVISHQHMKSLNYVHDLIYFSQIFKIKQFFDKTLTYAKAFEKQYMKRYPSQFNSQNNRYLNQKYSFKLINQNKYNIQNDLINEQLILQKKPGFILSKSRIKQANLENNKSPNKNMYKKQNFAKNFNYKDGNSRKIEVQSSGSDIIYSQYQLHRRFEAETSKEKNSKFDFSLNKNNNEREVIYTVRK